MKSDPATDIAAVALLNGCNPFPFPLLACTSADWLYVSVVVERALEIDEDRREDQAVRTANNVGKLLGG